MLSAFISHPEEERKLVDPAFQQDMAEAIMSGVRTYFAIDNEVLTIVVVGVDIHGEDCTQGLILGNAEPCPFSCPTNSPLL